MKGRRTETHGPFASLYLAMAKACELLKMHPIAVVSIDNGDSGLIADDDFLPRNANQNRL
jgi:hypothetical protein